MSIKTTDCKNKGGSMKTIWICDECHEEVKAPKELLPINSVKIEFGFIVKRIICAKCCKKGCKQGAR